jgi:hypothetical protein
MRALLRQLRRLPLPRLLGCLRLAAEITLVAALLGRPAPEPAPRPRQPAFPRYLGTDGNYFGSFPDNPPVLLDTETGALVPCPVAGMGQVGPLGCSPWRDGAGQYHLAGTARESASGSHVLMRCAFPAGRVLDQVKIDVLAFGRPCWFPDGSDRILFAGGDRRLYVCDFGEVRRAGRSNPAQPRALRWEVEPPGVGEVWFHDPCWPGRPALGGRLIVALALAEDPARPDCTSQLWWLQLSVDGDAIVGAERAIVPEAPPRGPRPPQESLPSVGMASDGTPLLAYMAQNRHGGPLEVWVSPISPAAPDHGPRVLHAAGRKLAESCAYVLPAFSADGRWVYAWRWVDGKLRPERLAVPIMGDVPAASRRDESVGE